MMSKQIQTQVQVQMDPLQEFLQVRLKDTQFLEDAYYVYLKKPSRSYWKDLEALLDKPEVFYWYAFTFAGHNKLYNLVWGNFVDGEVTIESGCTYRINSKARIDILNKVKELRKNDEYYYLGGGVRDRYSETMNKYLRPEDMSMLTGSKFQVNKVKNRRDLEKVLEKKLGLPSSLLLFILDKIVDALEHSKLSLEAVPKPCPELNDCSNAKDFHDPECDVYFYGTECYLDSKDRDYKNCPIKQNLV